MKECIQIKNLCKKFISIPKSPPLEALSNINLTIEAGDIYGIMGTSGAGKSTLLRCMVGLEKPSSGSIFIDGKELNEKNPHELLLIRRSMGMVFQHFHLFSSRTVAENIAFPLEIQGIPFNKCQERIDELLVLVELESKKDQYPSQLSGGEKQRVGIARALANHPKLLLCDEPTSALDCKTTRSILQLLLKLNRSLGLTIVVITHQIEVVKQLCQHVAVLSHGKIVESGPVKEVFARPKHSLTRHLLNFDYEQISIKKEASKKLVRLHFEGHQAHEPVVSQLIRQHQVEANILAGNLDHLQSTIIGHLLLEFSGHEEEITKALNFLSHRQVYYEVIV